MEGTSMKKLSPLLNEQSLWSSIEGGCTMKTVLLLLGLMLWLSPTAFCESILATTPDGKPVRLHADGTWTYQRPPNEERAIVLHPNGTWSYQEQAMATQAAVAAYTKPGSATTFVKGATVPFGIWVDTRKWRFEAPSPEAVIERWFTHASGEAWGAVIAENARLTFDDVRDFVVASAKNKMPDAAVREQETRLINGQNVLFLHIEGTYKAVPWVYLNYDYVGEAGTIQVYAWTPKALFQKHQRDLLDFLNGFTISRESSQSR
jgi:hypothetical protein